MEKEATLSCTFCRTNKNMLPGLVAKSGNNEDEFGLEGVTELQGLSNVNKVPEGLKILQCSDGFNQSLLNAMLPSSLQSLTFGFAFNQSLTFG